MPAGGPGRNGPAAATVVFPIFPGSQFLGSYNAGKGQRYYLYGTTTPYLEVVAYYRTQLKDRGDEVFAEPPTHMFQDKFRPETMAFPPGVTVKDWTYQSKGLSESRQAGAQPDTVSDDRHDRSAAVRRRRRRPDAERRRHVSQWQAAPRSCAARMMLIRIAAGGRRIRVEKDA